MSECEECDELWEKAQIGCYDCLRQGVLRAVRDYIDERSGFGDCGSSVLLSVRLEFDEGGRFEVKEEGE